jgi:hypothetical protein
MEPSKIFWDYQGTRVRLTDERWRHIHEHPEMTDMDKAIEETLTAPEFVFQSSSDPEARLYYRYYLKTLVGGKFLCVVVKWREEDAFVLTAYLTDRLKKGELLWTTRI